MSAPLAQDNREDGRGQPASPADADDMAAQLREAHKRIKLPSKSKEAEVMRRAVGYLSRDANAKLRTRLSSTLPLTTCPSR